MTNKQSLAAHTKKEELTPSLWIAAANLAKPDEVVEAAVNRWTTMNSFFKKAVYKDAVFINNNHRFYPVMPDDYGCYGYDDKNDSIEYFIFNDLAVNFTLRYSADEPCKVNPTERYEELKQSQTTECANINIHGEYCDAYINVEEHREQNEINWSAIGSVSPERALQFAKHIEELVELSNKVFSMLKNNELKKHLLNSVFANEKRFFVPMEYMQDGCKGIDLKAGAIKYFTAGELMKDFKSKPMLIERELYQDMYDTLLEKAMNKTK